MSLETLPPPPLADVDLIDRGWKPVWQAHREQLADGTIADFDRSALDRAAANGNRLIELTGTYGVIIEGHTADGDKTPRPVQGYLGPFKTGEFGGKPTLFARERYRREFEPRLKDFPHKSAEYVFAPGRPTDGYVAAVALLDAGQTPRFHLGLNYSASLQRLRYSLPDSDQERNPMDAPAPTPEAPPQPPAAAADPAMVQAVLAAILPAVKQVVGEVLQAAGVQAPAASPDEKTSPEGAPSPPSPSPGGAPDGGDESEKKKYADATAMRLRYEREQAERRRVEEELVETRTKLVAVEGEKRRTARYAALDRLRADGYVMAETEAEFKDLEAFDDATFEKAIEQRRRYGQRVPRGVLPIPPSDELKPPVDDSKRPERAAKAAALARTKGISFDAALAEVG